MKNFRFSQVAMALLSVGLANVAYGQEAATAQQAAAEKATDNEEVEVIEITGFRRSLIDSINQKRFADTVSEQLSADDLGALPDVSMADALTRLPGISAVRTGGQAAEINIRGMSGGFISTTLNGREQVSTSGQRSVEFDQYPSELISNAAVYKSPKVSMIEGGVAGSVEMTTASPLKNEEVHTLTVNARGMYNDLASDIHDATSSGHRLSLSYQGKYLEDTLGFALGVARLFQPSATQQFIGLAYNKSRDVDNLADDTNGPANCPECEYVSEGFELQHKGGEETRDGFLTTIEWQPTDNFNLKFDGFYSKFDSEEFARGYRVKLEGGQAAISNPVYHGNSIIGGSFNRTSNSATRIEVVNDDNTDHDKVKSLGLNADWDVTERLNVNVDLSYSSAESNFRNGLIWSLVSTDANAETPEFDNNVAINYGLNGLNLPDVGFNQADALTDLNRVMVSKYGIYPYENKDEVAAARVDFSYQLDNQYFSSVEFGARYSEREYTNKRSVFEYGSDSTLNSPEAPLKITSDMATVVNWSGDFSYFPSYLALDQDAVLNAWFSNGVPQPVQTWGLSGTAVNGENPYTSNYDWTMKESGTVFEDILAVYFMANIDTELAGVPVTGNIGVRMVDTKQAATSLQNVGGDISRGAQYITDEVGLVNDLYFPTKISNDYIDYLPQMNLNFSLNENDQIRFAAAKVMSRPNIDRLASNTSFNLSKVSTQAESYFLLSGQSKNSPHLKPFYATQYDLSYEQYFNEGDGSFIAAIFYKDIESAGIITQTISEYDFSANGLAVPSKIVDPVSGVPLNVRNGNYETAFNDEKGGYIRGAELTYTQIFSFLPEFWSGLGLQASYSYTESQISQISKLGLQDLPISLPGLSKNAFQATVFWEYQAFETRASVRYRDKFVSEQVAVDAQTVNYDGEMVVDYQASYQINDNFNMVFQINNLTDEPTKSYFGVEAQTGTIQYFGRQFFLGMTYSL